MGARQLMNFERLIHPPYWICDLFVIDPSGTVSHHKICCDAAYKIEAIEYAESILHGHLRIAGGTGRVEARQASVLNRVFRALKAIARAC